MKKKRNWIIALVAIALIAGCVIWETMSLVISCAAIIFIAANVILFVAPSLESFNNEDYERES